MTKIYTFILLLFSAVVLTFLLSPAVGNTAPPISTNQHDQNSVNNPSGQNGNQHFKDSVIRRNSTGGEHHGRWSKRDKSDSNATDPHREMVTVPLLSW